MTLLSMPAVWDSLPGPVKADTVSPRCDVSSDSKLCSPKSVSYTDFSVAQAQNRGDNSSDGRVVRASASAVADSGLIPSRVKPMTLKLVFTASLLDA